MSHIRIIRIASFKDGAPIAQWIKRWPTDVAILSSSPARGEIFSTVNGVPLLIAFHPPIDLI